MPYTPSLAGYQALSAYDAKGDILAATAADTSARLAVGSNGLALVADSTQTTGLKYSGVAGLLDYASYAPNSTNFYSTTSTTYVNVDATNLVVTFTAPPSGKVRVMVSAWAEISTGGAVFFQVNNAGTEVFAGRGVYSASGSHQGRGTVIGFVTGLTPGTPYTYTWGFKVNAGTGSIYANTSEGAAVIEVSAAP